MNAQMYDPQYVAARLAARRVQPEQPQERPMARRHNLTNAEMAELRELIAGDADVMALGAFAQRCNIHGSSMKAHARAIRRRLAEEAEEQVESVADAPPVLTVQSPPAVVVPVASPPAAPNGLASVPPAARIGTVIEWLTAIRAMRDELREHGVLVEGTVSITVDL